MSDTSVLAQEYTAASELSQLISEALIVLKKAHLDLAGAEHIPAQVVERESRRLGAMLAALGALLGATSNSSASEDEIADEVQIPAALVKRLEDEHRGDLDYFLDDIRQVAAALRDGARPLKPADLQLLDQIADVADAEASSVFRRLMRM